jgi:hypothetical protein
MTPWNETPEDIDSEKAFALSVSSDNNHDLGFIKLEALKFEVDFAIASKSLLVGNQPKILGVAEIKIRNTPMSKYPTLFLNLTKWMSLRRYSILSDLPFVLLVRWQDQDAMFYESPATNNDVDSPRFEVAWGGRSDRGQEQDMNPLIHIPIFMFEPVSGLSDRLKVWHKPW